MSDYIIVYAVSEAHFRAVRGAIGQPDIVHLPPEPRTYDDRIRERRALSRARCIILAFTVTDLGGHIERLRGVIERLDAVPRLLVTDHVVGAIKLLGGLRVDGEISFQRLRERPLDDLPFADPLGGRFERWARWIGGSPAGPDLRRFLAYALRHALDREAPSRPRGVADAAGVPLERVARQLRELVGGAFTLSRFLAALSVIAFRGKQGAGMSIHAACAELSCDSKTLRNRAKGWLGCTPKALDQIPQAEILARFEREFLDPLRAEKDSQKRQEA